MCRPCDELAHPSGRTCAVSIHSDWVPAHELRVLQAPELASTEALSSRIQVESQLQCSISRPAKDGESTKEAATGALWRCSLESLNYRLQAMDKRDFYCLDYFIVKGRVALHLHANGILNFECEHTGAALKAAISAVEPMLARAELMQVAMQIESELAFEAKVLLTHCPPNEALEEVLEGAGLERAGLEGAGLEGARLEGAGGG
jgi:hypothetical protein